MAGIAELFAAVDLSGVSTGIESIFITLIGIAVLGAAFIYVKRAIPGRF
jgi:LPXTG-motif cell wall-anchored protein